MALTQYMDGYATHLPMLMAAVARATGPVLELGCGEYSTRVLHEVCRNRDLVSMEFDYDWFHRFEAMNCARHQLLHVTDWATAPLESRHWGVVFVDQDPGNLRHVNAVRVAQNAEYVVCHDSENPDYVYDHVAPHFKYACTDTRNRPWTTVFSNFHPVDDLGAAYNQYLPVGIPLWTARDKKVLIGVPVKNCAPYLRQFTDQILGLEFIRQNLTVAFLENDSDDNSYELCCEMATKLRAALITTHVDRDSFNFKCPHTARHRPEVQVGRLSAIAKARQLIVDRYLPGHDFVMWFDADFEKIPSIALAKLVVADRDITVPVLRTHHGDTEVVYDLGSSYTHADGTAHNTPKIVDEFPPDVLVSLEWANAAALVKANVYETCNYRDIPAGDQEGAYLSRQARQQNLSMVLRTGVNIQHAAVNGMLPL